MKFILSSLFLISIVTENYWTLKLSFYVENIINANKITFHSIEYFCFYLNNQILAIRGSRDSTSSPFGVSITTELSSSGF